MRAMLAAIGRMQQDAAGDVTHQTSSGAARPHVPSRLPVDLEATATQEAGWMAWWCEQLLYQLVELPRRHPATLPPTHAGTGAHPRTPPMIPVTETGW